jgi:hypothetical protein
MSVDCRRAGVIAASASEPARVKDPVSYLGRRPALKADSTFDQSEKIGMALTGSVACPSAILETVAVDRALKGGAAAERRP